MTEKITIRLKHFIYSQWNNVAVSSPVESTVLTKAAQRIETHADCYSKIYADFVQLLWLSIQRLGSYCRMKKRSNSIIELRMWLKPTDLYTKISKKQKNINTLVDVEGRFEIFVNRKAIFGFIKMSDHVLFTTILYANIKIAAAHIFPT